LPDEHFSGLHDLIKQTALNVVETSKPSGIFFGTVVSSNPLQIQVDQKLTLDADFLILTSLVKDFTVDMTVNHSTDPETAHTHGYFDSDTGEGASGSSSRSTAATSHLHTYTGRKSFTIHFGLQAGEKVILMRVQGGQQFIVLDRVRG